MPVPNQTALRENTIPVELIVIFPNDAITLYHELSGPGSYTLVSGSGDKTILGVAIQQSGTASQSDIRCGASDIFIRNYGKDFPFNLIEKYCNGDIVVEKTGQDSASYVLTYVARDLRTSQYATASAQYVELGNQTLLSMHGLSWMLYIGIGLALLMIGIRIGFMFLQK